MQASGVAVGVIILMLALAAMFGGALYRMKAKSATSEKKAEAQEDYHDLQNEVEAMPDDKARDELRNSMRADD